MREERTELEIIVGEGRRRRERERGRKERDGGITRDRKHGREEGGKTGNEGGKD